MNVKFCYLLRLNAGCIKRGGSDFRSHLRSHIPGNSGNSNLDTTNMSICYVPGMCLVPSQVWSHLVPRSVLEDGWSSPFSKHEEIEVRKIKITGLFSGELGNGPKASNSLSVISLSFQDQIYLQSSWIFFSSNIDNEVFKKKFEKPKHDFT